MCSFYLDAFHESVGKILFLSAIHIKDVVSPLLIFETPQNLIKLEFRLFALEGANSPAASASKPPPLAFSSADLT